MEWISDPTAWIGLGTLVVLELVLGIDNLIFIAILVDKLPSKQQNHARIVGLTLALLVRVGMLAGISWLQTLTTPLFAVMGIEFTVRSLILIAGGLFLLLKATTELHARLEGISAPASTAPTGAVLWQVIVQIVVLDAVFSIDSVITAVGMVDHLAIMVSRL
jgi:predicted tellurium resistance membrane protein TerC